MHMLIYWCWGHSPFVPLMDQSHIRGVNVLPSESCRALRQCAGWDHVISDWFWSIYSSCPIFSVLKKSKKYSILSLLPHLPEAFASAVQFSRLPCCKGRWDWRTGWGNEQNNGRNMEGANSSMSWQGFSATKGILANRIGKNEMLGVWYLKFQCCWLPFQISGSVLREMFQ